MPSSSRCASERPHSPSSGRVRLLITGIARNRSQGSRCCTMPCGGSRKLSSRQATSYSWQAGLPAFGSALCFMTDAALQSRGSSEGFEVGVGPRSVVVEVSAPPSLPPDPGRDCIVSMSVAACCWRSCRAAALAPRRDCLHKERMQWHRGAHRNATLLPLGAAAPPPRQTHGSRRQRTIGACAVEGVHEGASPPHP